MVRELKLPDVGEGIAEGEIVSWLVEPGDSVTEDQPLAEVETDKAVVEIPSPITGTVAELHAEEGEIVPVGTVIVTFEEADDEAASTEGDADSMDDQDRQPSGDGERAASGTEAEASPGTVGAEVGAGGTDSEADAAETTGRVFAPPRVRRLARELDVDLGSIGNGSRQVTEADVRNAAASADDQAATSEATTTEEGEVPESEPTPTNSESGAVATVGTATEGGTSVQGSTTPATQGAADRSRTLAAPATRQLARELGVDIDAVPASEERDGEAFVTPEDVQSFAESGDEDVTPSAPRVSGRQPGAEAGGTTEVAQIDGDERVPYRGVRRTIGERMAEAKYTAPHATHHDSVDVSELAAARERLNETLRDGDASVNGEGADDVTLTYLPFVVLAVVDALQAFPAVNSTLDEDAEEIVYRGEYNVGIATATDAGLMVPVLKNADQRGLVDIARETRRLVDRARSREISPDELHGGTFTITNFGAVGGDHATPIVNYPEAAILGLGTIKQRPVVVDGEVEARRTLPLSLSVDHRLIDGAVAAQFTNRLKENLRDPVRLLL